MKRNKIIFCLGDNEHIIYQEDAEALSTTKQSVSNQANLPIYVLFGRLRKRCERCGWRKTYYIFEYGTESFYPKFAFKYSAYYLTSTRKDYGYRHRICAMCMNERETEAFRRYY